MQKLGLRSLRQIGAQKSLGAEAIGIGGEVVETVEDTRMAEQSGSWTPNASKPTKSARSRRKRARVSRNEAFRMIQSGIHYFQQDGGSFAVLDLPQRTPHAVAIIFDDTWPCVKCKNLIAGEMPKNRKCVDCNEMS